MVIYIYTYVYCTMTIIGYYILCTLLTTYTVCIYMIYVYNSVGYISIIVHYITITTYTITITI